MAKKEYHFEPTEGATPLSLIPSEFMGLESSTFMNVCRPTRN
jgi:hypothetical protein